jgi:hypothetical protein
MKDQGKGLGGASGHLNGIHLLKVVTIGAGDCRSLLSTTTPSEMDCSISYIRALYHIAGTSIPRHYRPAMQNHPGPLLPNSLSLHVPK